MHIRTSNLWSWLDFHVCHFAKSNFRVFMLAPMKQAWESLLAMDMDAWSDLKLRAISSRWKHVCIKHHLHRDYVHECAWIACDNERCTRFVKLIWMDDVHEYWEIIKSIRSWWWNHGDIVALVSVIVLMTSQYFWLLCFFIFARILDEHLIWLLSKKPCWHQCRHPQQSLVRTDLYRDFNNVFDSVLRRTNFDWLFISWINSVILQHSFHVHNSDANYGYEVHIWIYVGQCRLLQLSILLIFCMPEPYSLSNSERWIVNCIFASTVWDIF